MCLAALAKQRATTQQETRCERGERSGFLSLQACRSASAESSLRVSAKLQMYPLDGSCQLYAVQDEHSNQIGTGTRETCYRLLAIYAQPLQVKAEGEFTIEHLTKVFEEWLSSVSAD